jgi:hypothetical protein
VLHDQRTWDGDEILEVTGDEGGRHDRRRRAEDRDRRAIVAVARRARGVPEVQR